MERHIVEIDGTQVPPPESEFTRAELSIMAANERAERDYPPVEVEGYLLHVFQRDGEWDVWLNTEASCFDGLCLGVASTRDEAVRQAVKALEAATAALQQAPR